MIGKCSKYSVALPGRTLVHRRDHLNQLPHARQFEHLLRSARSNVRERAHVEQAGIHRALLGQVLDDQVDELDLCIAIWRARRDSNS